MTNPNTDTVEAVALLAQNLMSRHLQISEDEIDGVGPASYAIARAIAAMPGSGEAMREAAAKKAEDYGDRNCPADYAKGDELVSGYAKQQAAGEIADEIRALLLPQGGGSVVRAAEPYAYLCTAPDLDPVIVYSLENAETYAAHSERWTVEPLYRGARLAAPLPPAQEG